jgi:hypothetical protein
MFSEKRLGYLEWTLAILVFAGLAFASLGCTMTVSTKTHKQEWETVKDRVHTNFAAERYKIEGQFVQDQQRYKARQEEIDALVKANRNR